MRNPLSNTKASPIPEDERGSSAVPPGLTMPDRWSTHMLITGTPEPAHRSPLKRRVRPVVLLSAGGELSGSRSTIPLHRVYGLFMFSSECYHLI